MARCRLPQENTRDEMPGHNESEDRLSGSGNLGLCGRHTTTPDVLYRGTTEWDKRTFIDAYSVYKQRIRV